MSLWRPAREFHATHRIVTYYRAETPPQEIDVTFTVLKSRGDTEGPTFVQIPADPPGALLKRIMNHSEEE